MTANCSFVPTSVPSDAGVAGIGVLLGFIVTAVVSLILSASLIFQDIRNKHGKPSVVRRKLLNSYSDQQILTGIGIQSVGLAKMDSMVPYHFFIIWMLSLLSMAVHNATLLALVQDFRRDWVIRWLRQFLMFVNLVLSCVFGVFVLQAVQTNLTDSTLAISCVWQVKSTSPASNAGASFVGTIAVIAANVIIFGLATWYLHRRTQRFYKIIQVVGLILMAASAVGATIRVILVSQAFNNPPISLSDEGERVWSFGSLLQIGLLLLPLMSIVEIMRGEVMVAPPVAPEDEDKTELLEQPRINTDFQANPLWGPNRSFFEK